MQRRKGERERERDMGERDGRDGMKKREREKIGLHGIYSAANGAFWMYRRPAE